MPKLSPVVALDRILANLTKQWQEHHTALAHIEVVFSKFGINPARAAAPSEPAADTVAPAGKKRRRRGKRGKFAQTAEEFVLSALAGKMLATKEINTEWAGSGRRASADNTLTKMVKERKLKRVPNKDGRGSKYAVA